MKLNSIIYEINKKYPENIQYDWDNSGLNIGKMDQDIKKIMLTLEVTSAIVDEAIEKDVDLIISHHPFIFSKINKIVVARDNDSIKSDLIYKLIKNDICVYSMHTSYDLADNGLNDYFLKLMGYKSDEILEVEGMADFCDVSTRTTVSKQYGLGRVVRLEEGLRTLDFLQNLKGILGVDDIRFVGDPMGHIKSFAVVTGSGAEYFSILKEKNIDLLITGDLKYHQAQDAKELGVMVADFGHFGTEDIFAESLVDFVKSIAKDCVVEISEVYNNPIVSM